MTKKLQCVFAELSLPIFKQGDDLAQHTDHEKIPPSEKHSDRTLQDGMRGINFNFGETAPEIADRYQRAPDEKCGRFDPCQSQFVPGKEERLALDVNPGAKRHAYT